MPKVRGVIPNLINGVSQQAQSLRLPSQSEEDFNTYPLVVDGLVKRPPTQHLTQLANDIEDDAFVHHILRDDVEQYTVTIESDGTVRVFDHLGNEKTVNDTSGGSYFSEVTDAKNDITAMTIADHTFICNKKKKVLAGSATAASRPYEAFVWVKQGAYGNDYNVNIDGTQEAAYQTPDGSTSSHVLNVRTNAIAQELYNDLDTGGFNTSPWNIARYASTIYIENSTTDFDIMAVDSRGDTAMVAIKDEVARLSDLPYHNKDGFKIKITGSDAQSEDDYWVEFKWNSTNSSRGTYTETIAPGAKLGLDDDTMPHLLVRESNGTFTFKAASWTDRETGDEESNPDPSFVDDYIVNMTFYKSRLGLLTESNIVFSASSDYYNFYQTTMTAVLDGDPIDFGVSHKKVSLLSSAAAFQDELILFSAKTQFRVSGNDIFTPASVASSPATEFESSLNVDPITNRSFLYFIYEGDYYAHLVEWYFDKGTESGEGENVSGHCPNYIPAGVFKMTSNSDLGAIIIATTGDPDGLYLYKTYTANREKLQSAWVQWQFPGVERMAQVDFYNNYLFLTVRREDGYYYTERINCEEGQAEAIHLDRREIVYGTHNATTDKTTFTVSHTPGNDIKIVTASGGSLPLGVELPHTGLVVDGDYSNQPVAIGYEYTSRHKFSTLYHRTGQQQQAVSDGRTQIKSLNLSFSDTSYFEVKVDPENRPVRTYIYTGQIVGDEDTQTGVLITNDSHATFPIFSKNDRVNITIYSDNWRPFAFNSARWRGNFNPYSREV